MRYFSLHCTGSILYLYYFGKYLFFWVVTLFHHNFFSSKCLFPVFILGFEKNIEKNIKQSQFVLFIRLARATKECNANSSFMIKSSFLPFCWNEQISIVIHLTSRSMVSLLVGNSQINSHVQKSFGDFILWHYQQIRFFIKKKHVFLHTYASCF